jgi:Domain of unknown function (DUF4440)
MDDLYAINSGKTEFREAFNTGDPERLIALLDPAFIYMPDGVPTVNGSGAADAIRARFRDRFYLHTIAITSAADRITVGRADQMSHRTCDFLPTLVRCVTLENGTTNSQAKDCRSNMAGG